MGGVTEGCVSPNCSTSSGGKTRDANALRKIPENSLIQRGVAYIYYVNLVPYPDHQFPFF